jgi:hypothetical protein
MGTTKVQDENAKIQAAMTAKAEATRAKRAAAQKARRDAKKAANAAEVQAHVDAAQKDAAKAAVLSGIQGILSGTTTAAAVLADPAVAAVVKAPRVRTVKHADGSTTDVDLTVRTPEQAAVALDVIQAETEAKVAAVKASSPKAVRVLADPVDNARLIRMRAKWTAERRERDVARLEKALEEGEKVAPALKAARVDLETAVREERAAYAEYRTLLEAAKAAKKAGA